VYYRCELEYIDNARKTRKDLEREVYTAGDRSISSVKGRMQRVTEGQDPVCFAHGGDGISKRQVRPGRTAWRAKQDLHPQFFLEWVTGGDDAVGIGFRRESGKE